MTIDKVQEQEASTPEKPPVTVQNEIQKDVVEQTTDGENTQKNLLALLAAVQPKQQIDKTAQDQLEKGHIDIKV